MSEKKYFANKTISYPTDDGIKIILNGEVIPEAVRKILVESTRKSTGKTMWDTLIERSYIVDSQDKLAEVSIDKISSTTERDALTNPIKEEVEKKSIEKTESQVTDTKKKEDKKDDAKAEAEA